MTVLGGRFSLDEYLPSHEIPEPLHVQLWLHGREEPLVGAQEGRLEELLRFLVAVPELQEVYY